MRSHPVRDGFSLIELVVVVAVFGILVAMSVPGYARFSESRAVKGSAQNITSELRQLRARAMSTGEAQTIHFALDSTGAGDYHVHNGTVVAHWDLPRRVSFATGSLSGFTLGHDGRASRSGYIIVQDTRGMRDTVSVQLSGLVLER